MDAVVHVGTYIYIHIFCHNLTPCTHTRKRTGTAINGGSVLAVCAVARTQEADV